jgi:hypothetical protein
MRMDLFHGTRVLGVGSSDGPPQFLSAAFVDGDAEDASSMLVSVVEDSFRLGPNARDEAATKVSKHLRDELGLDFQLERVDTISAHASRVEVRGAVRQGTQVRQVLVALFTGDSRRVVVSFSVPSGRWEALTPALRESLDSLRVDQSGGSSKSFALAFAIVMGAGLLFSFGLMRRRAQRRASDRMRGE